MSIQCLSSVLFLIIGLILISRGGMYFRRIKRLNTWLPVEATIMKANVGVVERPEVQVKIEYYFPDIRYTYFVGEKKYSGSKYSIDNEGWWSTNEDTIKNIVRDINKQNSVTAYYDPQDNSSSVLVRDVSKTRKRHYIGLLGSGVFVVGIGVLIIILCS